MIKPNRENAFDQALNALCDSVVAYENPLYRSQIQPFEAYATKLRFDITDSLNSFRHSFRQGYELVINQIAKKKSSEEQEKYHIPGTITTSDELIALLEQKEIPQAVFDYSGKMMGEVYELGVRLRQDKRQDESASVFVFLITLNPYVCSFWQGLGKAWHEQQRFKDALNAYTISINCDPYRISSYRDAVRCCLDNKSYEEALIVLNHGLKAVEISTNGEGLKDFKKNVEMMKNYVETMKRGNRYE